MKHAPFIYGTTVSDHSFTDRETETVKLRDNLTGGINTCIISPRRWGKSSLVEKVLSDIRKKEKGIRVVSLDLFSVNSEAEFLELFAQETLKASSPQWQDWVKEGKALFKALIPKLSIGLDPVTDFTLSFDLNELKKNKEEALDLPEIIAKRKGVQFIICLDEFQNLAKFKGYEELEKKMRSVWQRQKHVTYCLYGSKRHMMAGIFNDPSKPFYRFGDIMHLQKIPAEKWVTFITESFKESGKSISSTNAMLIPSVMKNHPWYVQQLSHYTWNCTTQKATEREINTALNELMNANTPFYQRETEELSATQLNLLKAVAKGAGKWTSGITMQQYQLGTPRNVLKNKDILINKDIIYDAGGVYEFLDPAFELWFKWQYFKVPFLQQVSGK